MRTLLATARACACGGVVLLTSCAKIIGAQFSDLVPYDDEAGAADRGTGGTSSFDAVAPSALVDASDDGRAEGDVAAALDAGADSSLIDERELDGALLDARSGDASADVAHRSDGALNDHAAPVDAHADASVDVATDANAFEVPETSSDATDSASGGTVVINELNATGSLEDFIELYNPSDAPIALGEYGIAQAQQSFGAPDLGSRLTFAAGTTLGAGERIVIIANQVPPAGGPFAPCPVPRFTVSACYTVTWGISKAGERLYIIGPDGSSIVQTADYPTADASVSPGGVSWGRVPDGTGAFQWIAYSPGAPNSAM